MRAAQPLPSLGRAGGDRAHRPGGARGRARAAPGAGARSGGGGPRAPSAGAGGPGVQRGDAGERAGAPGPLGAGGGSGPAGGAAPAALRRRHRPVRDRVPHLALVPARRLDAGLPPGGAEERLRPLAPLDVPGRPPAQGGPLEPAPLLGGPADAAPPAGGGAPPGAAPGAPGARAGPLARRAGALRGGALRAAGDAPPRGEAPGAGAPRHHQEKGSRPSVRDPFCFPCGLRGTAAAPWREPFSRLAFPPRRPSWLDTFAYRSYVCCHPRAQALRRLHGQVGRRSRPSSICLSACTTTP